MSDSLRDQLLKAGFSAPKATPKEDTRRKSRPSSTANGKRKDKGKSAARHASQASRPVPPRAQNRNNATTPSAEEQARIAERKAIKARIKALIEADAVREFQGESVYRFMVNQRIRELHVKPELRQQLVEGTLSVTRLNGSTWLVPATTATAILALNPDWVVVTASGSDSDTVEGYEDFPVPDDLQW